VNRFRVVVNVGTCTTYHVTVWARHHEEAMTQALLTLKIRYEAVHTMIAWAL